jgi:hypothetical protein
MNAQPSDPKTAQRNHWGTTSAVVGVAATLTAVAALLSAPADASPTGNNTGHEEPFSRPCFTVQSSWNAALDGEQPTCPGPVTTPASHPQGSADPAPPAGLAKAHQ